MVWAVGFDFQLMLVFARDSSESGWRLFISSCSGFHVRVVDWMGVVIEFVSDVCQLLMCNWLDSGWWRMAPMLAWMIFLLFCRRVMLIFSSLILGWVMIGLRFSMFFFQLVFSVVCWLGLNFSMSIVVTMLDRVRESIF